MRSLIVAQASVNGVDKQRGTPLWYAIRDSRASTARLLLAHGALPPMRIKGSGCDGLGNEDLFDMARDRGLTDVHAELRAAVQRREELEAEKKRQAEAAVEMRKQLFRAAEEAKSFDELDAALVRGGNAAASDPASDGLTPLHIVAARTDSVAPSLCERLVRHHGASSSATDACGRTPLFSAARAGADACVAALLDCNAEVDATAANGENALFEAARHGHASCVSLLLARKAPVSRRAEKQRTAVFSATIAGSVLALRLLLQNGGLPDAVDEDGCTCLFFAENCECTGALLELRCDPCVRDQQGRTALFAAIQLRREAPARLMLEAGASAAGPPDNKGQTPLHFAMGAPLVRLLVDARAEVDARDLLEQTPLFAAARAGSLDSARALVALGARGDVVDSNLRTPLFEAALHAPLELVRLLVQEAFADPNAKDRSRKTAGQTIRKVPERQAVADFLARAAAASSALVAGGNNNGGKRRRYRVVFEDAAGDDIGFDTPHYGEAMSQLGRVCPWLQLELCSDAGPPGPG